MNHIRLILPIQIRTNTPNFYWFKLDWLLFKNKGVRVPAICINSDDTTKYNILIYKAYSLGLTGEVKVACDDLVASLISYYQKTWGE